MRSIHAVLAVSALLAVAGCSSSVDGGARPADDVETTTSAAPAPVTTTTSAQPTPTLVPAAGGGDLLLKRSELGAVIGDTDLVETQAYNEVRRANVKIEPWACRSRALAGETGVWAKKPTLVGNANRGAGGQAVTQMVSIFENPADITGQGEALWIIDREWRNCPDGDIFFIELDPETTQRWVPYPIITGPDRMGTTFKRDGEPRNCHHVVSHRANVLVEVIVCTDGDSAAPANTLTDRILANVPT
ncbi:sensor domain-containing protein [Mycolicibacterium sp. GF69]|uniref:sensor domain-containing protein n=1 Tax=Mycolicibacterium sp. GF69 TaxID=2267251 RepID=UPI0014033DE8|nr:sensor domain-containing protein [Mycolicibacterium sp. GF69]